MLTRHGQSEWNKLNLVSPQLTRCPISHFSFFSQDLPSEPSFYLPSSLLSLAPLLQFTGWKDPALTEQGKAEALKGAGELKKHGYTDFDMAFTSALTRAQNTLAIQLKEIGQEGIPTKKDQALNERDYGELTGLNKDDARKKWGEDQVSSDR